MYMREDSADEELTNAAKLLREARLFLDQSRLSGLRLIDIEVRGGTVILRGEVATFHQIQLAAALVRKVAGVGEVINLLKAHQEWEVDRPPPAFGLFRQKGPDRRRNDGPI